MSLKYLAYMSTLKKHFGFDDFNEQQKRVMKLIANGSDVLAICPTGSGKSLLYQVPALTGSDGLTILLSPLLSTILDQFVSLELVAPGKAKTWSSDNSILEKQETIRDLCSGKTRILICSPEAFENSIVNTLNTNNIKVARVCVDEAHLIAAWGVTFRTSFNNIGQEISKLSNSQNIQIIALTATADSETSNVIIKAIGRRLTKVAYSPIRDNLTYKIIDLSIEKPEDRVVPTSMASLSEMLRISTAGARFSNEVTSNRLINTVNELIKANQKTLIFCATKKKCDLLTKQLQSITNREILTYHGGISREVRRENQSKFTTSSDYPCMVSTNSFGVGVDIPDIRTVIHADAPPSVDAYLQETGRAGRDGKPSTAILFSNQGNEFKAAEYLLNSSLPTVASIENTLSKMCTLWDEGFGRGFDIFVTNENRSALFYLLNQNLVIGELEDNVLKVTKFHNDFDSNEYEMHRQYSKQSMLDMKGYVQCKTDLKAYLLNKYETSGAELLKNEECSLREDLRSNEEIFTAINAALKEFSYNVLHCNPNAIMTKGRISELTDLFKSRRSYNPRLFNLNMKVTDFQITQLEILLTKYLA